MSPTDPHIVELGRDEEAQLVEYRSISALAIAGLILGLLSWLAMLAPLLWIIAAAGAVVCAVALRRIDASEGALVGRKAALWGLALSLMFGSAAVSRAASHAYWIRHEAAAFAQQWFDYLLQDEPHKAHQLGYKFDSRQELGPGLWQFYRNHREDHEALREFIDNPTVRALLALGSKATVKYWGTEEFEGDSESDFLTQVFAIIIQERGGRRTFFVRVVTVRTTDPDTGADVWRIQYYEGGVRPFELPERP